LREIAGREVSARPSGGVWANWLIYACEMSGNSGEASHYSRRGKGDPVSGFWTRRNLLAGAVVMAGSVFGTSYLGAQTAAVSPPAATPPASMPAIDPNAPIAVINGRDINNARFYSLLMEVAGM